MIKGKSRLKQHPIDTTSKVASELPRESNRSRKKENFNKLVKYLKHSPTLILGIVFYFIIFFIFKNFSPDIFKNVLIPNSYLPILFLLFMANFFLFSFIFLNSIRGFIYSLFFLLIVFFKMQNVVFEGVLISILFGFIVVFEIIIKVLSRLMRK